MSKKPVIVFEGIEASGKSTSLKKIIKYLKNIDFGGWITIHQPLLSNQNVDDAILEAKKFFTL